MTTIKPLKNNIMFKFLDETAGSKGKFNERTKGLIVLPTGLDSAQKQPRWAEVIAVGPEAAVEVGEYIYIEALQWTFGTEVDGVKMWKTDDSKVILATTDIEETYKTGF